jgi:hypothetical protein
MLLLAFSPQYFHAHSQMLKIGKIAKFEPLKVREDQIFKL